MSVYFLNFNNIGITLPNPEVSNTRKLKFGTVVNRAINGTLYIYNSIHLETIELTFSSILQADKDAFVAFNEQIRSGDTLSSNRDLFRYRNERGVEWINCVVLDNVYTVTKDTRKSESCDRYTFNFLFQGEFNG